MILTPQTIAAGCGAAPARAALFAPFIQAACAHYGIVEPLDVAAFLAQIGHESGRLVFTRELWGPTVAQRAYEPPSPKATELGNTEPGDGQRFLGRGLIQLTGRANYAIAAVALDLDLLPHPELLEQPEHAAMSAAWFWWNKKLTPLALASDFIGVTKGVNGGTNGLADRQALYNAAKKALGIA
jgi:putative chitinase